MRAGVFTTVAGQSCRAAVLFLLCTVLGAPQTSTARPWDLLIRNGRIVDGTGNPSFLADLAVLDGKIASIGKLAGSNATRVIDAQGLVVAPGFIDIHNHSDYTLLVDGNAQSMVRQGVTSMIFGEGGSAAPVGGKQEKDKVATWTDFTGYFSRLQTQGISTNVGTYVGSSQIWTYVRGERAGPPTPAELSEMQTLVRQAMAQGALGVASSLSGPPGSWIDTDTLVAMCKAAGESGGIYSTHLRTEGQGVFEAVAEAIAIGRRAGVPVDIIHLKLADHKLWGRMPELVASIQAARNRGEDVTANVYPYRAGQNNLASIIPPWAHEGGTEEMLKRLKDPALHARLVNEIENGIPGSNWYNHYTATGDWEGMLLVSLSNPAYKKFEGKRMSQVIQTLGGQPIDVLFKILADNNGSVPTVYFHHDEKDMRFALAQPWISIGSDGTASATEGPTAEGHPHPRYFGTFPRVLGRYVREEKVLTLEEAVRKMTSANASKLHFFDRGLLRPGMWADITVFDPAKIIDHATYDAPAQYATGVEYVAVNGKLVLDAGKHTGARPGTILHGAGWRSELSRNLASNPIPHVAALNDRAAAEWVIRQGGNVQIAGQSKRVRTLADLPDSAITLTAIDLIGTLIEPKELWKLSALASLRELLLPGPSFNTGAGSTLDANEELAALANLHKLETLSFSLHFLTNINVQDKGLDYLKGLTQIKDLRLTQTKVLGKSLAPFTQLQTLDLNETPFKDEGMPFLRGMTHLRRLSLRDTFVTDAGIKNLEQLTELESLDLYGTRLTDAGLRSLAGLKKLRDLNLLGTEVTDDGAAVLASLPSLENLNLYRTGLTNSGLDRLKALQSLSTLDVRYTRVTSGGVEALRSAVPKCAVKFEGGASQPAGDVALRQTKPEGAGDSAVAAWVTKVGGKALLRESRLVEIDLSKTPISDAQVSNLAGLAALRKLSLATTGIGDLGVAALGGLPSLRELNLANTLVTDRALPALAGLDALRQLVLTNTQVQGSGFAALKSLPLQDLELSGAPVTDAGLQAVAALAKLETLRLSYTNVSDTGMAALASAPALQHLDLSSTDLGDLGLAGLKPLHTLTALKLSYTRVTDAGLQSLSQASALEELELARTRISDKGAAALAKLPALKRLNLNYTTVSDKGLAQLLTALPNLAELQLDSTGITDDGAKLLAGAPRLKLVNLYHTLVTEKAYGTLKDALPQCQIVYDVDSALPNRRHS